MEIGVYIMSATYSKMAPGYAQPLQGAEAPGRSLDETVTGDVPCTPADLGMLATQCFENEVPSFVKPELERLYGSLYSSLPELQVGGKLEDASTYVVRQGGDIVTLLLFRRNGRLVEVLNEVIELDGSDLARFTAFIFENYPSSDAVSFRAVRIAGAPVPFVHQRFPYLEDFVAMLPGTEAEYVAGIGKSSRRSLRRHMQKLEEQVESYRLVVCEGSAIDPVWIADTAGFNRACMAGKKKVSGLDALETDRLVRLAGHCGLGCFMTIDGRVAAGSLSFRAGNNYFMRLLAHDPAYNAFGLGMLCCLLTIQECIKRGGNEFHFLWGRYDYKYQFQARERCLERIVMYRSRLHALRNAGLFMRIAAQGYAKRAKDWLHGGSAMAQRCEQALTWWRHFRYDLGR